MTINHEALADSAAFAYKARVDLVDTIQPGELERYREDIRAFIEAGRPGAEDYTPNVDSIIVNPRHVITTPALFRWMRDNHRGPWAPPPEPEGDLLPNGYRVGELIQWRAIRNGEWSEPRAVIRRPTAHGPERPETVWFACPSVTLVHVEAERVRRYVDPEPATPTTEDGVQPIGPDHPGWPQFLAVTKEIAVEAGYCGEYEHMVERIEQRLRPATREQVTIEATVRLTLTVAAGDDPDPTDVITGHQWEGLSVTDWHYTERGPVRD